MDRVPKGWMFTFGLSILAVVTALITSSVGPMRSTASEEASIEADSCFRYGRVECCVKGE